MKHLKRILAFVMVAVMAITLTPIEAQAAKKKVSVSKVETKSSLSGDTKTVVVAKGKKVKLSTVVTVTPDKAANKKVTYKSANKKIATVTSKGVVKGVKAGTTKITVTSKKNKKKKATIKVKVAKGAVTKIQLDQTAGTVELGKTVALKATVSGKSGAVKTLAWKSSNEAVATVNESGVVTAAGVGSATITASAIDGSGKKATYKVTVNNPTYLVGMKVMNSGSLSFSLNRAMALNVDQVVVMSKVYPNGVYRNQISIENMYTVDNINYTVVIDSSREFQPYEYVQLSIPSLDGAVKTMEGSYEEPVSNYFDEYVYYETVGDYDYEYIYPSISSGANYYSAVGCVAYEIQNLPPGFTVDDSQDERLKIEGTPTSAGKYETIVKMTDELGNVITKKCIFLIGNSKTIVAHASQSYLLVTGKYCASGSRYINVNGGSGTYRYKVISDPSAIVDNDVDAQGYVSQTSSSLYLNYFITNPGEYKVVLRVEDVANPSLYTDVTVNFSVKQGVVVTGFIKDMDGNPMPGYVCFENKDKGNKYTPSQNGYSYSDDCYYVVLAPGTYNAYGYGDGSYSGASAGQYKYNQTYTTSTSGVDFQLPLYRVYIKKRLNKSYSWYCDDEYVGYGNVIYLKAGTYQMESSTFYKEETVDGVKKHVYYKYVTNKFTVVDSTSRFEAEEVATGVVKDCTCDE